METTASGMGMNLSEFLRCSAMYACRLSQEKIIDAGDLKPFNREYSLHKEVAVMRKIHPSETFPAHLPLQITS